MDYTYLTGTGMQVSRLCVGTFTFGDQLGEEDAVRAVHCALDQGVNFFDTANLYANGASEEILGKALAGRREAAVVATKVGNEKDNRINAQGSSRRHILRAVEASLRRLRTDHVDIYYLHTPDYHTPPEESLEAMDSLVRSGKVRYIGSSNFAAWQACRLHHEGLARKLITPVVTQMVYNLITRDLEREFVPFLKAYRMGLVVYNPLAGGFLTEKYADKRKIEGARFARDKNYENRYWNAANFAAWDSIRDIAAEAGISMPELAMRWLYSTGHVDAVITGFSSLAQLEANLRSLDRGLLSAPVMEACDAVWKNVAGSRFQYNR